MSGIAVAVLAVHPERSAATRLRATQYGPAAAAQGIDVRLWSFFDDADLDAWYGASHRARVAVVLGALLRLHRLRTVLRGAGIVLVQREALPFGPPVLEWLAARRGRRLVWDVDDSLWQPYVSPTAGRVPRWLRATGDKYARICRRADEVWAGSEVLAAWCRRHSSNVHVVPTVVDVPCDLPPAAGRETVCWIGSHSTGEFVEAVLPALSNVDPAPRVVLVGANPSVPHGVAAEIVPWSPEAEEGTLREARIGLYPVDRAHPLSEGKCGLKAILYMAHGIPVVATPTSTNAAVVRDGVDGLYAEDLDSWTSAVQRLLDDEQLWESCRRSAHERALEEYSLARWAPWVIGRLRTIAGRAA